MNTNHTPGPWAVNPLYPAQVATADGGLHIASACTSLGADAAIANAALIAAAPDLLAAIRRVARLNPDAGQIGPGMLQTIVSEARSAIAKAAGGQQ